MLRTLAFVLTLGASSAALGQQFPDSPLGQEVRGHDGTVLGRVTSVERDADGNIVAVEIPGLEPPDAPNEALVAERARARERVRITPVSDERPAGERTRRGSR
ncbi:MAG: hypothetical protein ACREH4_02625 [Vitreimonas sp.]